MEVSEYIEKWRRERYVERFVRPEIGRANRQKCQEIYEEEARKQERKGAEQQESARQKEQKWWEQRLKRPKETRKVVITCLPLKTGPESEI